MPRPAVLFVPQRDRPDAVTRLPALQHTFAEFFGALDRMRERREAPVMRRSAQR